MLVNGSVASNLFSFNADGSLNTVFAASLSASQAFDNGDGIVSTNAVLAVQADGKVLLAGVFNPFSTATTSRRPTATTPTAA